MEDRAEAPVGPRLVGGRYRLGALLGEGGMGTVWRATDEVLDREVAVKQVRLGAVAPADVTLARARMLREAKIAAKLQHPSIVSIFDVVSDDALWLILEYVPSCSLAEVLADRGPMSPADVATIGAQIAAALAAAHAGAIVHRDIKPANVLLVDDDAGGVVVKVTDWGISRADGSPDLTGTNVLSGTPAYFAPEVALGAVADARSDVYALGATLHELLDGAPPFGRAGDNVLGLLVRIARDEVPAPRRGGPLADVVARLTAAEPAARPSAAQVARQLRGLPTAGVGAPSLTGDPPALGARPTSAPPPAALPASLLVGHRSSPGAFGRRPTPAATGAPWWRRRWVRSGLAVLVATAVAVPLWVLAGPVPDPVPVPPRAPVVGRVEIGDVRTADPCSLQDPGAWQRFGTATLRPGFGAFAGCVVNVQVGAATSDLVQIDIEFSPPLRPTDTLGGRQEQLGEVTVARYREADGRCRRIMVLSDRNQIVVDAVDFAESPVDLCQLADVATSVVVDRLVTSAIGRRASVEDDSPLSRVNACGLLLGGELTIVPGLDATVMAAGTGGWLCFWGVAGEVSVQYNRGSPLDADDGTPVDVAGRSGFVEEIGDKCRTVVAQRRFTVDGFRREETVAVWIGGPLAAAERCRLSTTLLAAVVPRLPPPS